MKNPVKTKMKAGKPSIGTWVNIAHPSIAEILAGLGFEWLTFDMQHSIYSIPEVERMLQAMSFTKDCIPLVRVPWNEPVFFQHTLDIGAYGVIIPLVNTREDALRAVEACKYPPKGFRSLKRRTRVARYDPEYIHTANEEILIAVMIETRFGLKNLDEILSVRGVDAVYIGPGDLSWNLGIESYTKHLKWSWEDEKFQDAIHRVLDACKRHNTIPGIQCTAKYINQALDAGFLFIGIGDDAGFLSNGAVQSLSRVSK
jgi:4-hydroxy-2-oxoheptanedioate aldolase